MYTRSHVVEMCYYINVSPEVGWYLISECRYLDDNVPPAFAIYTCAVIEYTSLREVTSAKAETGKLQQYYIIIIRDTEKR